MIDRMDKGNKGNEKKKEKRIILRILRKIFPWCPGRPCLISKKQEAELKGGHRCFQLRSLLVMSSCDKSKIVLSTVWLQLSFLSPLCCCSKPPTLSSQEPGRSLCSYISETVWTLGTGIRSNLPSRQCRLERNSGLKPKQATRTRKMQIESLGIQNNEDCW